MVFDLLSLGSKLRVWSSASPFHPPVVLRFQRVPMATNGGNGKTESRAHSEELQQFFRSLMEKPDHKPDGCPPPLSLSEDTLREWARRQKKIPKGPCVDERNVEPGGEKRRPRTTPRRTSTRTSASRGRQGQNPQGKNTLLELNQMVRCCVMCRSTIMQESASGAMSPVCEDCSYRVAYLVSCILAAWCHPPPPPGLDPPAHW